MGMVGRLKSFLSRFIEFELVVRSHFSYCSLEETELFFMILNYQSYFLNVFIFDHLGCCYQELWPVVMLD